MSDHVVKDSGKREEFHTGSRRDSREGKGRYDLISVIALKRLALVYERGAAKYGDNNWMKGQPLSRYLDSAMRHIQAYAAGDRSEDHIMQAAWNCFALAHTEELITAEDLPDELHDLRATAMGTESWPEPRFPSCAWNLREPQVAELERLGFAYPQEDRLNYPFSRGSEP